MYRLTSTGLALALVLCAAVSTPNAQTAKPSALVTSLQGTWQMTNSNGQDLAGSGQEILITIKDNTYVQSMNGTVVEKGTFKIDESKKPMTLDLTIAEGDSAGKIQVGVVEVTGKTMRGKLAEPGATTRPTDFAPTEGTFVFTMVKR